MYDNIFQEIDRLHSEWEGMDKSAKLGWLMGTKMRLNGLANQFARYISLKGGNMSDVEKAYAQKLQEMIAEIDSEGSNAANDLVNYAFRELVKSILG